jgi:hypothetical protein
MRSNSVKFAKANFTLFDLMFIILIEKARA